MEKLSKRALGCMYTAAIIWALVGIGALIAVILGVVLGYQTLLWAKTYISVEENTRVIERNTINAKRNTIGLKNLLEMILGTCKVKLDTNSFFLYVL